MQPSQSSLDENEHYIIKQKGWGASFNEKKTFQKAKCFLPSGQDDSSVALRWPLKAGTYWRLCREARERRQNSLVSCLLSKPWCSCPQLPPQGYPGTILHRRGKTRLRFLKVFSPFLQGTHWQGSTHQDWTVHILFCHRLLSFLSRGAVNNLAWIKAGIGCYRSFEFGFAFLFSVLL